MPEEQAPFGTQPSRPRAVSVSPLRGVAGGANPFQSWQVNPTDEQHAAGGVVRNAPPPTPPYRACTQCGGYLQGSRGHVGICLNCSDGRGWVVQQAERKPWMREGWEQRP